MDKHQKYFIWGIIGIFLAILITGAYARIWEYMQPTFTIKEAMILKKEHYKSTNDLHWNLKGYRVLTDKDKRIIDFPENNIPDSVKEHDTIDLVVRRSFSWFGLKNELDGIEIIINNEK